MKTNIEVITPEIAREYLGYNTRNRNISVRHVDFLAKAMTDGTWDVNGDSIRFAGDMLLDGQHRLMACINSGVSFTTLVIRGLDASTFDTIDIGKKRSAGDTLSVLGVKNSLGHAGALAVIIRTMSRKSEASVKITNKDIEVAYELYDGLGEHVYYATSGRSSTPMSFSHRAAFRYMFSVVDECAAHDFFDKIDTGVGLENDSPELALRNRMLASNASKSRIRRPYIEALIIKAWNYKFNGRTVKALRYRTEGGNAEEFPVIDGLRYSSGKLNPK